LPKNIWDALLEDMAISTEADHWGMQPASLNRALRLNPGLKAIRDAYIGKIFCNPNAHGSAASFKSIPMHLAPTFCGKIPQACGGFTSMIKNGFGDT
jgi:hypothetical protein